MTSFALALINDSLLCKVTVFQKSTYTNLKAEWLSLRLTAFTPCTICLFWFVHQLNREHSHRAICFLSAHRNANLSIYPALPASPLRSLCCVTSTSSCWQPALLLLPLFFTVFSVHLLELWGSTHPLSVQIIKAELLSAPSVHLSLLPPRGTEGILERACLCVTTWLHQQLTLQYMH